MGAMISYFSIRRDGIGSLMDVSPSLTRAHPPHCNTADAHVRNGLATICINVESIAARVGRADEATPNPYEFPDTASTMITIMRMVITSSVIFTHDQGAVPVHLPVTPLTR